MQKNIYEKKKQQQKSEHKKVEKKKSIRVPHGILHVNIVVEFIIQHFMHHLLYLAYHAIAQLWRIRYNIPHRTKMP